MARKRIPCGHLTGPTGWKSFKTILWLFWCETHTRIQFSCSISLAQPHCDSCPVQRCGAIIISASFIIQSCRNMSGRWPPRLPLPPSLPLTPPPLPSEDPDWLCKPRRPLPLRGPSLCSALIPVFTSKLCVCSSHWHSRSACFFFTFSCFQGHVTRWAVCPETSVLFLFLF